QQRPILRVQASPAEEPRYGMIFRAAAIYQGILFCRRRIHTLGLQGELAPGLTLARFVLALARRNSAVVHSVPIAIGLDDKPPEQRDYLCVLVSTLTRLFLGIRPYWGTEAGPLHYTAVQARPQHLLRALPHLLQGRPGLWGTPENGYFSHNAHEVRMTLDSGFTLDGELYTADARRGPLVIRHGGQASFLRL
ncbi:MAG: hypothetical protein JSW39_15945, partial [Desulfobacterales bacterium]